jgi:hypothetical protein
LHIFVKKINKKCNNASTNTIKYVILLIEMQLQFKCKLIWWENMTLLALVGKIIFSETTVLISTKVGRVDLKISETI